MSWKELLGIIGSIFSVIAVFLTGVISWGDIMAVACSTAIGCYIWKRMLSKREKREDTLLADLGKLQTEMLTLRAKLQNEVSFREKLQEELRQEVVLRLDMQEELQQDARDLHRLAELSANADMLIEIPKYMVDVAGCLTSFFLLIGGINGLRVASDKDILQTAAAATVEKQGTYMRDLIVDMAQNMRESLLSNSESNPFDGVIPPRI